MTGIPCNVTGCDGRIEATAPLWLKLDEDGSWSVYGIGDEASRITCDENDHDNWTPTLDKSLSAFIEEILPGTTWVGSDPRDR